jgi:hypothetical protein
MFRVFDSKRMELLKDVVTKKGYYSASDLKEVQDVLWSDFPYIMGPLSELKEGLKDIIPIIGRKVGSPTVITEAAKSPGTMVVNKEAARGFSQITVNPLIVSMEEARSAGAVVPYHFIDGAEMAKMFTSFVGHLESSSKKGGILGVHDAIITSIDNSDVAQHSYNKGMFDVNNTYSIMDAIKDMLNRLDVEPLGKKIDSISSKGLSIVTDENVKFSEAVKQLKEAVEIKAKLVYDAKNKWKEVLDNAWYGNMVGTPGGMYKKGQGVFDYEGYYESSSIYNFSLGKKPSLSPSTKKTTAAVLQPKGTEVEDDSISTTLKKLKTRIKKVKEC